MEEEGLDKADLEELPTEMAPQLDESVALSRLEGRRSEGTFCPLCSRLLPDAEVSNCPQCGGDIKQAREAIRLSEEILVGIERALRQGDLDTAERGLMQLDQVNLRHGSKATYLRAKLCFLEKDYAKALAMANTIFDDVDIDKDLQSEIKIELPVWQEELRKKIESQEHYNFALSRVRDGYFEEARDHLLKALKLAPHLLENFRLLGKVCMKLRAYDDGRYYLERALLLDEEDPATLELIVKFEHEEKIELMRKQKRRFFLSLAVFFSATVIIGIILGFIFIFPNIGK